MLIRTSESRELYQAPKVKVFEAEPEGMVCASGRYNGFGEEEIW